MFAVITKNLFVEDFPEGFGTRGGSVYTLFPVMTRESGSMGIARPVMEVCPYAGGCCVPFVLIATFTMLNLFIGIIVSAMQSFSDANRADTLVAVEAAGRDRCAKGPARTTRRLRAPRRHRASAEPLGLSQQQLAHVLGVSRPTVTRMGVGTQ